jgi:hypothetical protein
MAFTLSGDVATTRTNLGLGDAATKTTGTASGNIPVLDSSGQIADAQIAALSVSKLSGVGTSGQVLTSTGTTTAPTMQDVAAGGKILAVHPLEHSTRIVMPTTGSNTAYTEFVNMGSFTKSSTSTDLFISASIVGMTAYHGRGQYWMKIDTGTWYPCGGHSNNTNGINLGLTCYIPAAQAGASGSRALKIGMTTGITRTFNILNPNSTDHSEYQVYGRSVAVIMEVN